MKRNEKVLNKVMQNEKVEQQKEINELLKAPLLSRFKLS